MTENTTTTCTICGQPALTYEDYNPDTGEYTLLTLCDDHAINAGFCPDCGHHTSEQQNRLCICPTCSPVTAA